MENSNLIIRIPEPCHEDWNKMQPDDKGKFCGSCCKSVVDFSNKTDEEIRTILIEYKDQKVCGHFKKSQIDRPLNIRLNFNDLPKNVSTTKAFAIALFLVFGSILFSCTDHSGKTVGELKIENTEQRLTGAIVAPPIEKMLKGEAMMVPDSLANTISVPEEIYANGGICVHEMPLIPDSLMKGDIVQIQKDSLPITAIIIPHAKDTSLIQKTDSSFKEKTTKIGEQIISHKQNALNIFPNPSTGEFTVKYDVLKRADVTLNIMDINGKIIRTLSNVTNQYEGKYQIPVNANDLPNGIYIVNLINNGERFSGKVIIEK